MKLDFQDYREIVKQEELKDELTRTLVEINPASIEAIVNRTIKRGSVEPICTINKELHQIGYFLNEFQLSDVTREYLSKHPEVKLYKVRVRDTAKIRRKKEPEIYITATYLFETDENEIPTRITEHRRYQIASNTWTPVRHVEVEVLGVETLELKELLKVLEQK